MKQALLLSILFIAFPVLSNAQENNSETKQKVFERITESLTDDLSEESDYTSALEDLEKIANSPIDLNRATRSVLEQLYFLSSFQIETFLAYRKEFGQILSLYELQTIEGFTDETVENMSVFATILPLNEEPPAYFHQELNFRVQQNIERQKGFEKDLLGAANYSGIQPKILLKYRAEKGERIQFGFTAENDAGEDFFNKSNPNGFDFYSGFMSYKGKKLLKEIYIGDYQMKTGQGLIQWTGYGGRKSSDVSKIRMIGQGLRASTSADENNFMRGIATTFAIGNFQLSTFYSNHKADANIEEKDSTGKTVTVSSLQISGYHRTEGEITDENALRIQLVGANLKYTKNQLSIGVNGNYQLFDATLSPELKPYNTFYFRGNNNYNLSTDFLWVQNKINLFGEAALSKSKGNALILGMEAQPSNQVTLSMLYRNFSKIFHSINGSSFAESSGNSNEQGFYTGISILPVARTKLSAYIDTYQSHWMKFTSNAPVKGTDFILQAEYNPSRKVEMYLRFKTESNNEKSSVEIPIKDDEDQNTKRVRINVAWKPTPLYRLQFRTEWSGYEKADSTENGFLVFTDLNATTPNEKLSGTIRVAWFNTDSYNSRIYAYENDVPLSFYIPALYQQGWRFFTNLKYQLSHNLTFYFKYAITNYTNNVATIGTGNSKISGNRKSDFKIHLKYRF